MKSFDTLCSHFNCYLQKNTVILLLFFNESFNFMLLHNITYYVIILITQQALYDNVLYLRCYHIVVWTNIKWYTYILSDISVGLVSDYPYFISIFWTYSMTNVWQSIKLSSKSTVYFANFTKKKITRCESKLVLESFIGSLFTTY